MALIYWSLFHPVAPDPGQMEKYVEKASDYDVAGFEICGLERLGLDRYLLYEDYPDAAKLLNEHAVHKAREEMNGIVRLAHESGRKILFWHREVHLPEGLHSSIPGLVDEKGEIDFNGDAFWDLIRYKIREFFKVVPGMDGLVLTLTESDYSVVHNSDTNRYPPVEVAARFIRTFAETLKALNKSITFRTFGSIDEDYRILSSAADLALKDFEFEIETKITPFDWSLYLKPNPYLKQRTACAAEFDLVGEFFGLGEIPCLFPDRIIEQVRYACNKGCKRLPARLDRLGRSVIDSVNEINLYTFHAAVNDPDISEDRIWNEYIDKELIPVMKSSQDMIKKSYYIDGHMFSQNPIPTWQMLMLGGIFSVFKENIPLDFTEDLWSMLSDKTSPTHKEILKEKEGAVAIAEKGYETVRLMEDKIPETKRETILTAWDKARYITRMHLNTARILCAYFEDMEKKSHVPENLDNMLRCSSMYAAKARQAFPQGLVYEFARAVEENAVHFRKHYEAELAAKMEWEKMGGIIDYAVSGGITYEWRIKRYMHASKVDIVDKRPVRVVSNKVFPNGFLEYRMKVNTLKQNELIIIYHTSGGSCKVIINGKPYTLNPSEPEGFNRASIKINDSLPSPVTVRIEKEGNTYPVLGGIGVRAI